MARSLQDQLKQKIPFDLPEEEVALNIQRTYSAFAGPSLRFFKQYNLSPPLYNILRILRGAGRGGLSCSQIGERLVARVPDVTRLLDRLEQNGWAIRRRSSEDRRLVTITITPKGRKLVDKLDKPTSEQLQKLFGHLTKKEMTDLNRLLVKARQRLEG